MEGRLHGAVAMGRTLNGLLSANEAQFTGKPLACLSSLGGQLLTDWGGVGCRADAIQELDGQLEDAANRLAPSPSSFLPRS
jgi:hypothetical protein